MIASSRRSAPVARWIKKQSGGRARLVHLIHTQAPLHLFDLVITTPQYRLPHRPNVLHNTAPLNRPAPDRLAAAASRWQVRLGNLPRPYTALLVGGNSSVYELDPATATILARQANAQVRKVGGSLLVSTSPRTPASVVEALFAALDCPAHCYRWRPNDTDNPYLAYLALADSFIVTVDSASQVVEACLTNKPVYVFTWPTRARSPFRVKESFDASTAGTLCYGSPEDLPNSMSSWSIGASSGRPGTLPPLCKSSYRKGWLLNSARLQIRSHASRLMTWNVLSRAFVNSLLSTDREKSIEKSKTIQ